MYPSRYIKGEYKTALSYKDTNIKKKSADSKHICTTKENIALLIAAYYTPLHIARIPTFPHPLPCLHLSPCLLTHSL